MERMSTGSYWALWTRCKNKVQKSLTQHPSEAKHPFQRRDRSILDLFPIILPRYLLWLAAAAAWHFISLSACSHFLTLLSDISTASLCQINRQKHSPVCMWPRLLCFFQFLLLAMFSHQRQYFTDTVKTLIFPVSQNYPFLEALFSSTRV